jgi:Fe2+ or Zn2+ uptake regulation protein
MAQDDARDLLRRHNLRSTPQRRAILAAFRGAPAEHLSAEEVLARAASTVPEIGRGTVYATLAELAELGLLASVGTSEPVRYETNLSGHDHFHCRLCLRLFDVDLGASSVRRRRLEGFTIERVAVRAEGICRACHEYQRGLGDGTAGILERPTLGEDRLASLACATVASPLGELAVAASPAGIARVAFEDHADAGAIATRARSRRGPSAARDRLRTTAATLEHYFAGDRAPSADLLEQLTAAGCSAPTRCRCSSRATGSAAGASGPRPTSAAPSGSASSTGSRPAADPDPAYPGGCATPRAVQSTSGSSAARSRSPPCLRSRETCICEQPSTAAISDCLSPCARRSTSAWRSSCGSRASARSSELSTSTWS